ncbi:MAG: cytochrome c3 family protein [Chloroflexi bacterium]|nr:cytochrome c3 family protein [Chloroflexota bacterium]
MVVLKTLVAFFVFWAVIFFGMLVDFGKWLARVILRSRLRITIAFLLVAAGTVVGIGNAISSSASQQLPPQPVVFQHTFHAGQLNLTCVFCHRTAPTQAVAGVPSLEQCMFCHRAIGRERPEVAKLVKAYQAEEPLNWLRINRLPDTAHFEHAAHIRVNISCSVCHGEVQQMEKVTPIRSLKMGDCLGCHRSRGAPTGCSTCHY